MVYQSPRNSSFSANALGALKSRLVSMIYIKALKWSGGFIFYPIDLKIDMHANGGIGNNFYYFLIGPPGKMLTATGLSVLY